MNRTLKVLLKTMIILLVIIGITIYSPMKETIEFVYASQVQVDEPMHRRLIPIEKIDSYEYINSCINYVCTIYDIRPELIKSIVYQESDFNPNAKNGNCVGLMQISTRWHADRAAKLGVTDFYDPYSNILLGVDYLAELLKRYEDPKLVLMLYNMKHDIAFRMYAEGKISDYAKTILAMTENYKKGE
jgi:hypothetical protein